MKQRDAGVARARPQHEIVSQRLTKAELVAALRDLRAYHEDLLSSLQDGVIILDSWGCILSLNPAAEELTGFSASQIAGTP